MLDIFSIPIRFFKNLSTVIFDLKSFGLCNFYESVRTAEYRLIRKKVLIKVLIAFH